MAPALLEVGRIEKAHGLRGQVVVRLVTNRAERLAPGAELSTTDDRVLTVVDSTPHGERWIVSFRGVSDRDAAEALRGVVLRAEPLDDPDELWVHDLIGAEVVEVDGTPRGTVVEVHANPASDLLVLDSGALVPVRFVTQFDPGRRVEVDAPPGLFET
jgi:16S rRNA processing protein RimM